MQIRFASEHDQPAWDQYVKLHPDGLSYHFYAWLQAVHQAYGFKNKSLIAEKDDRICGILPLIVFKSPFLSNTLVSLPYCDAAGILSDNHNISVLFMKRLADIFPAQTLIIRSSSSIECGLDNQTDKTRMLLELPENSEAFLASMKAKLRSQVRKPERDGLTSKIGGSELVDEFYQVFAENMRDLGSPVHSKSWIRAIMHHYSDNAKIAVVYTPQGEAAAAGIILLHPYTVSIPWASSLRRFNRMNPNMLLYWTFLSWCADNDFRYFDFGRSTPGEGTYRFKQQWGAQPQPLYWYNFPDVSVAKDKPQGSPVKDGIVKLWQQLPLPIANSFGPLLRKYISL